MPSFIDVKNIGIILLSPDFRVIGMNSFAKKMLGPAAKGIGKSVFQFHPKKSHAKLEYLLKESTDHHDNAPVAMVIDVLKMVLMINVCKIENEDDNAEAQLAMTFINVTEKTGAELNQSSGIMELKKFPIFHNDSYIFLDPASIYYIEADGNYCKLHTENKSYYLHITLKSILERYTGPNFFRIHKTYIANLRHIAAIKKGGDGHTVISFDKEEMTELPVAKRRVRELKEALELI